MAFVCLSAASKRESKDKRILWERGVGISTPRRPRIPEIPTVLNSPACPSATWQQRFQGQYQRKVGLWRVAGGELKLKPKQLLHASQPSFHPDGSRVPQRCAFLLAKTRSQDQDYRSIRCSSALKKPKDRKFAFLPHNKKRTRYLQ